MKKIALGLILVLFLCSNAFAKNLPILECIINNPNGSKTTQIYELQEIERLDPTKNFKGNEFESF